MRSIPPSSSATRATTATAFATTWRSEASNPSSRRDRTVRRQSNTIGKPTSGATSSSDASIASSNTGASPPDTRKPRELTFRCYASQQRNSGSKPSTRPSFGLDRGGEGIATKRAETHQFFCRLFIGYTGVQRGARIDRIDVVRNSFLVHVDDELEAQALRGRVAERD